MNYKDVLADLKNKNLSNLYLFWGTEHYLMENTIALIREQMVNPSFQDLNYQILDGRELRIDEIINACETVPFMDEKRVVLVRELECFSTKRKNITEEEEERLIAYLSNLPSSTLLMFSMSDGIDKRKKIVKEIGKSGQIVEFGRLTGKDIHKWVTKVFNKYRKKIGEAEINELLELIGYSDRNSVKTLKDLENEIIKLVNYVGERSTVTKQDIELLAPRSLENDIFRLVESIGEKNGNEALQILNDMLVEGEPEIRILHMITRQFRLLYQVKLMENQGYTATAIAPKLGIQQFVVKKYLKQAVNFDLKVLRKALEKCLQTDESIKKGTMNQRLAVELLISHFTCAV